MSNDLTFDDLAGLVIVKQYSPETDGLGNELGTRLAEDGAGGWVVWDVTHGEACVERFAGLPAAREEYATRCTRHDDALAELGVASDDR